MELEIIKAIQSLANPFLDVLVSLITMLGETYFIIFIMIVLYYAVDKEKAKQSIVVFGGSIGTNLIIKNIFRMPRPIGQPGVVSKRVATATGYSFPSGHTQGFTTLFLLMGTILKNKWAKMIGWALVFLVGISRLYLGVHWPKDVLFGWLFAYLCYWLGMKVVRKYRVDACMAVLVLGLHGMLFVSFDHDLLKIAGVMLGAFLGFLIEAKYIQFTNTNVLKIKFLRVLFGVVVVFGTYLGLKVLFPSMWIFDYFRYGMVGLVATAGHPYLIRRFLS